MPPVKNRAATAAVQTVATRADLPDHLADGPDADRVDEPEVALQREVVPEPLGLLVRVDVASHPGNERHVVEDRAVIVVQSQ